MSFWPSFWVAVISSCLAGLFTLAAAAFGVWFTNHAAAGRAKKVQRQQLVARLCQAAWSEHLAKDAYQRLEGMNAKLEIERAHRAVQSVLVEFQLELPDDYARARDYVMSLEALRGKDNDSGRDLNHQFLQDLGYPDRRLPARG